MLARIQTRRRDALAVAEPLASVSLRPAVVRAEEAEAARRCDASKVLLTRAFSAGGMLLIAWKLLFTLHR
ncbi:hypothetical protein [Anaeromyxobacter paludicola]|uniref:Uncharacterized protein n=1 Tax=Anaeromyxobacter paludicola TaxID=2918171 RepID=A0ABM7X9Z0_9BACT|nr:hypothetical protein [Anaeromyxobacter paludicola]BDG08673.1 hypothetical protein AMPC_17860 [Anaeromyxobacter paludicola]